MASAAMPGDRWRPPKLLSAEASNELTHIEPGIGGELDDPLHHLILDRAGIGRRPKPWHTGPPLACALDTSPIDA